MDVAIIVRGGATATNAREMVFYTLFLHSRAVHSVKISVLARSTLEQMRVVCGGLPALSSAMW